MKFFFPCSPSSRWYIDAQNFFHFFNIPNFRTYSYPLHYCANIKKQEQDNCEKTVVHQMLCNYSFLIAHTHNLCTLYILVCIVLQYYIAINQQNKCKNLWKICAAFDQLSWILVAAVTLYRFYALDKIKWLRASPFVDKYNREHEPMVISKNIFSKWDDAHMYVKDTTWMR